jgi:hypothetical protein
MYNPQKNGIYNQLDLVPAKKLVGQANFLVELTKNLVD